MAESAGNYAAYHLYNAATDVGDAGVTGALVVNNVPYTGVGFWPFNNIERDILWNDKVGITCVEWFWYCNTNNPGGLARYLFEFKPRHDLRNNGGNNQNATIFNFKQSGGGNLDVVMYRVNGSNRSSHSLSFGTPDQFGVTTGQWYHSIIRYNPDDIRWEFLIGNMGRTYDGQVNGNTSSLDNITFNNSLMNQGSYYRYQWPSISNTPVENRGPLAICWPYPDHSTEQNIGTNRGAFAKFSILTKAEGLPNANNDRWLEHLWQGGIADLRFWSSSMDNVKTYTQMAETRDSAPFYQTGENSDLIHCWRFNNTGDTATGQQDIGKYTGVFYERDSYDAYVQHRAGWPYDISEPNVAGEIKEFTGIAVGIAEQVDFYSAAWAQDSAGNPIYREQPAYPLVPNNVDPDVGIEDYEGVEVRAIVSDLYTTSNLYWLPGTGTVVRDDEDSTMYNLVLPAFYINAGYGAIFSDVYLIDNQLYLDWLVNTQYETPYFENRSVGPFLLAASDASGTVSLSFMGAD